jgi:uncharacterized membrane protein
MKQYIQYLLLIVCVPIIIILGSRVFNDRQYAVISFAIIILACVSFLLTFEKKNRNTHKLVIIAVMVALSAAGRFLFAMIPGFKPVTAIVVITAMYFGSEAGFLTGALSAALSNFYFGQGPWTPFQMFTWGLIGFLAGLLAKPLKESKTVLIVYGIFAGIIYSLLMDIWTVLWYENEFNLPLYLAAVATALPYTVIYAVSNVVFLLWFRKPMEEKLSRIKRKYGI